MKKGSITVGIVILVVLLVVIGLVVLILTQVKKPSTGEKTSGDTSPPVTYSRDPSSYIKSTEAQSPERSAQTVKETILRKSGISEGGSGIITTDPEFQIEYIGGPDAFLVEIRAADFEAAKSKAEEWLISQGFSRSDLCKGIKVNFYIASSVRNSLPPGTKFNPNPSCY